MRPSAPTEETNRLSVEEGISGRPTADTCRGTCRAKRLTSVWAESEALMGPRKETVCQGEREEGGCPLPPDTQCSHLCSPAAATPPSPGLLVTCGQVGGLSRPQCTELDSQDQLSLVQSTSHRALEVTQKQGPGKGLEDSLPWSPARWRPPGVPSTAVQEPWKARLWAVVAQEAVAPAESRGAGSKLLILVQTLAGPGRQRVSREP